MKLVTAVPTLLGRDSLNGRALCCGTRPSSEVRASSRCCALN